VIYGTIVLLCAGSLTYLARAGGGLSYVGTSGDRQYELEGYRYARLPFNLEGRGPAPGEVRVLRIADKKEIDRTQVEDVWSVRDIQWNRFDVTFVSQRNGRAYRSTLDLPQ
jgi:hypothetical protein